MYDPDPSRQESVDCNAVSGRRNVRPIAWLAGLLLLSVVGLMVPLPDGGRILPKLGDMVHAPLFAGITAGMVLAWNFLRPPTAWNQFATRLVFASVLAFGLGGLAEVAQGLTGRTASLHDLVADACGIMAACCFLVGWASCLGISLSKKSKGLLLLIGGGFILATWFRPLASINDTLAMKREFPMLASFERNAELERWHFANCHARRVPGKAIGGNQSIIDGGGSATDGDWAMEVSYQPGPHSSATMYEMKPDWTEYEELIVDAIAMKDPTIPGGTIEIAVQIIDDQHGEQFQDICRKIFVLELGKSARLRFPKEQWNTIQGRPLDLQNIRYLDLQLASRPAVATVRYDGVRLISKPELPIDGLSVSVAQ